MNVETFSMNVFFSPSVAKVEKYVEKFSTSKNNLDKYAKNVFISACQHSKQTYRKKNEKNY